MFVYEISTTITTEKGELVTNARKFRFFRFLSQKKIENKDVQRSEAGSTGDRRKDVD
jgi:hypothetical protein